MLGVSNGAANRALQLLERRQIITRQQRRGAYIANLPQGDDVSSLRRVHFLVHQNYLVSEGVGNDLVLLGIQQELPGVHVQISFLPKENPEGFVADLIDQSLTAKAKDGFILVRAPYEVHDLLCNSGVPAVVYGGVYPGITTLTRIDRDMSDVGFLTADFLVNRGHKCIAFLARQQALPGDHDTMDAVRQRISKEGFYADAMIERFLPAAPTAIEFEVRRLFNSQPDLKGFLCRSKKMADAVAAVCGTLGQVIYRDVDIAVCDYYLLSGHRPQYVFPRPVHSAEEQGRRMARALSRQSRGEVVPDEIIPVKMDLTAVQQGLNNEE